MIWAAPMVVKRECPVEIDANPSFSHGNLRDLLQPALMTDGPHAVDDKI
jgi:hypothetical protein